MGPPVLTTQVGCEVAQDGDPGPSAHAPELRPQPGRVQLDGLRRMKEVKAREIPRHSAAIHVEGIAVKRSQFTFLFGNRQEHIGG